MTRPLSPSEFAEAVRDYADGVEDARLVRQAYAGQLVAAGLDDEPADPVDFAATLVAVAGVDVEAVDRERIEHAYQDPTRTRLRGWWS